MNQFHENSFLDIPVPYNFLKFWWKDIFKLIDLIHVFFIGQALDFFNIFWPTMSSIL